MEIWKKGAILDSQLADGNIGRRLGYLSHAAHAMLTLQDFSSLAWAFSRRGRGEQDLSIKSVCNSVRQRNSKQPKETAYKKGPAKLDGGETSQCTSTQLAMQEWTLYDGTIETARLH